MSEYGHIGDYDVFVRGEYLTTFHHMTYGCVFDFVSDFFGDNVEFEIRLKQV